MDKKSELVDADHPISMGTRSTDIDRFIQEQRAALLSLDEDTIRRFASRWMFDMPDDPEVFWRAVHKARTGIQALPLEERQKSKRWLDARGSAAYDDGDL